MMENRIWRRGAKVHSRSKGCSTDIGDQSVITILHVCYP